MAQIKNVQLPESVAANFKLVGNHQKYLTKPIPGMGRISVNVETLTPALAEKIVEYVPFLKRIEKTAPKPKAKKG